LKRGKYDSLVGNFIVVTNTYRDTYVLNSRLFSQTVSRPLALPDIIFQAEDLGVNTGGQPVTIRRSPGFQNNNAINGTATLSGPGQLTPSDVISFSKVTPWLYNNDSSAAFLTELGGALGLVWGAFDGTTNTPVVFPIGTSIDDLEALVLGGHN
jgi:hypothetical protein